MAVWFEGEGDLACSMEDVRRAVDSHGELFHEVVSRMPGLKDVELLEHDSESVKIRTNEGLMTRTGIIKELSAERVVIEYDERYEAGSVVTTSGHFVDEFTSRGSGVRHRLVISDLEAPGFMGFFYRRFGSNRTGRAFLAAHKAYFEA